MDNVGYDPCSMIDDEPDTEEAVPNKKGEEAIPKTKRGNKIFIQVKTFAKTLKGISLF